MWRRSTGKGAPGKERRAQWRGPGRGNLRECHQHQGCSRAAEQEADLVVLRDLRRTADVLWETGSAKNFEDITEQDVPDGGSHCPSCGGQSGATGNSDSFGVDSCGKLLRQESTERLETHETSKPRRRVLMRPPQDEQPTSTAQLEVRQVPAVEMETAPSKPAPEHLQTRPASEPSQSSETAEPRTKQPRESICEGTSHCMRRSRPRTPFPCQEAANEPADGLDGSLGTSPEPYWSQRNYIDKGGKLRQPPGGLPGLHLNNFWKYVYRYMG